MSLSKIQVVDSIDVLQNNFVQVRTKTSIVENGVEISSSFHRHVVAPGTCSDKEDAKVQTICAAVHTADVVAAYQADQARIAAQQEAAQPK